MGWNEVSFIITRNKISLQLNNDDLIFKYIKCIAPTSIIQLDQVMNIGEDFEGYIDKLYVNCIPYALTIGNKVTGILIISIIYRYNIIYLYIIISIYSFQICIYLMQLSILSLNYQKNNYTQIYQK